MKTDRVLTMDECLSEWGAVPMRVDPPARDALHIPIAEEEGWIPGRARNCNCDRWGYPYRGCTDKERGQRTVQDFDNKQQR